MLIFILIDVQYSQKAVFSFEKGSNHQNHSSSGSLNLIKKFPPVKFPILLLCPLFVDGVQLPQGYIKSHYEETVYFLPEIPGTH